MLDILFRLLREGNIYLIIYIYLLFSISFDFGKQLTKYKYIWSIISGVILTSFIAFRWETGTDWVNYKELFDSLKLNWEFITNVYHFDFGYVILNAICKLIINNYTFFLIIDSAIAIGLIIYLIIKNSKFPNISVFIFYTSYFLAHFMGSNRRMIAIALLLCGFIALFNKKYKAYIFWQVGAFLFHKSSIVGLIAKFIPYERINLAKTIVFFSISMLLGLIKLPKIIVEKMSSVLFAGNPLIEKFIFYTENTDESLADTVDSPTHFILAILKRSIFLILITYYLNKSDSEENKLVGYLYNLYLVGIIIYMIFNGFAILQVLSTYFAILEVILLTQVIDYSSKKELRIILPFIAIYGLIQVLNALRIYPDLYIPYQFVINNIF